MNKAFTLVELAIVIVIIGLLVGGVLQGQELIKQAEYRKVMRDIEGYKAASLAFYSKYNCIPGDCINAYRYFSGKNCGVDALIGTGAINGCNGNGNKMISTLEGQLFWQHLSYASLIKGTFPVGYHHTITRDNLPATAIKSSGISVLLSQGDQTSLTPCGFSWCPPASQIMGGHLAVNMLVIANVTPDSANTNYARGPLLSPMDAYEFDVKFDDGLYYSGPISGHNARTNTGGEMSCGTYTTRAYVLTQNDKTCMIVSVLGL